MIMIYLNGRYLPPEQALVPVLDRGFVFGDGVYEVIPVYHGILFRLPEHLRRLQDSLDGIRLANPHSEAQWTQILQDLVLRNGGGNLSLYLQVTRGVAPRDHAMPANTPPTVYAMCNPLLTPPAAVLQQGVGAISVADIRWQYCHIKAIALLPNILLRQQALDAGAAEAILIRDGLVTEGAASNIFLVKNGVLATPPKSQYLLPGITRDLVVELARGAGVVCEERAIGQAELTSADELWMTSSTKEILPITVLDGRPVGTGKPGNVWQRVYAAYQQFKQDLAKQSA